MYYVFKRKYLAFQSCDFTCYMKNCYVLYRDNRLNVAIVGSGNITTGLFGLAYPMKFIRVWTLFNTVDNKSISYRVDSCKLLLT